MTTELLANSPTLGYPSSLTTLAAPITTTPASGTVETITTVGAAITPLQGGQFRATIVDAAGTPREIILVTAGQNGTTWTITRGVEGSTPVVHAIGASIYHIWTALGLAGAFSAPVGAGTPGSGTMPDDITEAWGTGYSGKTRRPPIADATEYDLRAFYAGSSQPADVLGHIQDGLARSALTGGWLLVPDSYGPWVISGQIFPPPNSRMKGPGPVWFNQRLGDNGHANTDYQLPASPNLIGEAWIQLAAGANCPILGPDYTNADGLRGPSAASGRYSQWFTAYGIVFDHNGRNQTTAGLRAIDVRDSWYFNFAHCRLVAPYGQGLVYDYCNTCDTVKFSAAGAATNAANGVGDIASGTNTISNPTGTWAQGDFISNALIPAGAYVTVVSPLTFSGSPATGTATAQALTKLTFIATNLMAWQNMTTDSDHIGVDCHGASSATGLIDGAGGLRISGLFGYCVGGHNLWLRDTAANGFCSRNRIDVRLDNATKHNCRIDSGVHSNSLDIAAMAPGINNTPNDSDGGWASVFCDGTANKINGVGDRFSVGQVPNMSCVVAYGPNAEDNIGGMVGGSDLTAGVAKYNWRPTSGTAPGTAYTNSSPAPPAFMVPWTAFVDTDGTTSAVVANADGTAHKVLSFPQSVDSSAVAYIALPTGCRVFTVFAMLLNLTPANAGNADLYCGMASAVNGVTLDGDNQLSANPYVFAVAAVGSLQATSFGGALWTGNAGVGTAPTGVVAVRFKRLGSSGGSDTLAASLGLYGVRVVPVLVA